MISELWQPRRNELDDHRDALAQARESDSLEGMLVETYGRSPPGAQPNESWTEYLDTLAERLAAYDTAEIEEAESFVVEHLKLPPQEFRHTLDVRERTTDARRRQPSQPEWERVEVALTTAWKRRDRYDDWEAAELTGTIDSGSPLKYWEAYRHRLPQWRASPESRREWREALDDRQDRPVVEPDLLSVEDFALVGAGATGSQRSNNPAYRIYEVRGEWSTPQTSRDARGPAIEVSDRSILETRTDEELEI